MYEGYWRDGMFHGNGKFVMLNGVECDRACGGGGAHGE